jgi:hypothetical protein
MLKIKSHFYRKKFDLDSFRNEIYNHISSVPFEETFEVSINLYCITYCNKKSIFPQKEWR